MCIINSGSMTKNIPWLSWLTEWVITKPVCFPSNLSLLRNFRLNSWHFSYSIVHVFIHLFVLKQCAKVIHVIGKIAVTFQSQSRSNIHTTCSITIAAVKLQFNKSMKPAPKTPQCSISSNAAMQYCVRLLVLSQKFCPKLGHLIGCGKKLIFMRKF